MSSPSLRRAPPQFGQVQTGSWTSSSRGRWSGNGLRYGFSISFWTAAGRWAAALAWASGVGVAFPFFGALRQLLEHRSLEARGQVDYTQVDHGGYTRLFGTGPFASLFGAAGFNRHLLHHWEPQVSYTCFDELEDIFVAVGMGPALDARRTTYGAAFRALYNRR